MTLNEIHEIATTELGLVCKALSTRRSYWIGEDSAAVRVFRVSHDVHKSPTQIKLAFSSHLNNGHDVLLSLPTTSTKFREALVNELRHIESHGQKRPMQYFRINTDLPSYRKVFPGQDDNNVINYWESTGHAYLTPKPDSNQYRENLTRAQIGDVLFAYQSGTGIVAVGEVQEAWDKHAHPEAPGLYPQPGPVYKVKTGWRLVEPPVSFAETGLGTAVGAFNEIPALAGQSLYQLCMSRLGSVRTPPIQVKEHDMPSSLPLNQILYGPPGTGKTYMTVVAALEILDPPFLAENRTNRSRLKLRFDELVRSGHVRFVTFHQSFSYEDFVEGLRADSGPNGELRYIVEPGIFKAFCEASPLTYGTRQEPEALAPYPLGHRFGNGYIVRRSTREVLELEKPNGRSLELGMGLLETLADYVRTGQLSVANIADKQVFEKIPNTKLEPFLVNGYNNVLPALVGYLLENENKAVSGAAPACGLPSPAAKVLIIDEINRGNIARIFGELITLIEPSKRTGAAEALETVLPYSKQPFAVPQNVYLIGTMNTADRSLTSVDIALRRRFVFREMVPDLSAMHTIRIEGLEVAALLEVMNLRIESLLDREHRIGHAYFMPLEATPTIEQLASIFRAQILPLLQEYFFEDWERVRWVLNDHRKQPAHRFISQVAVSMDELFGDAAPTLGKGAARWEVNDSAFGILASYTGIIKA